MTALLGIALLATGCLVWYAFIPARGQVVQRPEWLEVLLAITVTITVGCGVMAIVAGIANFLSVGG
jgi:hypothetical protein